MTTANQQIVHESETQRQFVRLPVPAQASINGVFYDVKDLSSGGLSLQGVSESFAVGARVPLSLHLPFAAFSMDITLESEVVYVIGDKKVMGCVFVNLSREQVALLNHVVKSFLAGEIVASTDLLNVAARENFTNPRKKPGASGPIVDTKRQIPGLLLVAVLGLAAAGFIVGNMYENLFTLKSSSAVVKSDVIPLRAVGDGIFKSRISSETAVVETDQVLGSVDGDDIKSPCDCILTDVRSRNGEYVIPGQILASLIPVDAKPWVLANLKPEDAVRLRPDNRVRVAIAGAKVELAGHVAGMTSNLAQDGDSVLPAGAQDDTVRVRIVLDDPQPVDLTGRPANVVFEVR